MRVWKTITNLNYDNSKDLLIGLKKKNFKTSPWIDDIFDKKNIDLSIIKLPIKLYRISLKI